MGRRRGHHQRKKKARYNAMRLASAKRKAIIAQKTAELRAIVDRRRDKKKRRQEDLRRLMYSSIYETSVIPDPLLLYLLQEGLIIDQDVFCTVQKKCCDKSLVYHIFQHVFEAKQMNYDPDRKPVYDSDDDSD